MKTTILIIAMFVAACSPDANTDENTVEQQIDQIVIGERLSLHSSILDQDRDYLVHVPESYSASENSNNSYPVLYLMDGGKFFMSVVGATDFMSIGINGNHQIPEFIVVAIPQIDRMYELSPKTSQDEGQPYYGLAVGGGDKFLQFMETELIPKIEADYRTSPHRTFVGHSLGGLMALYSHLTQPALFNGYIALDPSAWWDDAMLLAKAGEQFQSEGSLPAGRIFIGAADNDPSKRMLLNINAYNDFLSRAQTQTLQTGFNIFEGEDHGSVPLVGLYYGLLHVFDGLKIEQETAKAGADAVKAHYQEVSRTLGYDYVPPRSILDFRAMISAFNPEEIDKTIGYLKLNIEYYPNASDLYSTLAKLYSGKGELESAHENYNKALELDPANQAAIDGLAALEN